MVKPRDKNKRNIKNGEDLAVREIVDNFVREIQDFFRNEQQATTSERISTRVINLGNLIYIRLNKRYEVEYALGDTYALIGKKPQDLVRRKILTELFNTRAQYKKLRKLLLASLDSLTAFEDTIEILNSKTGMPKVFIIRGIPFHNERSNQINWEILAIDITDKESISRQLSKNTIKLQTLLQISKSIHEDEHFERIIYNGMKSLASALGAAFGYVMLYQSAGFQGNARVNWELTSALSLHPDEIIGIEKTYTQNAFFSEALKKNIGILYQGIAANPLFKNDVLLSKQSRDAIIVPLSINRNVFGIINLYSLPSQGFAEEDLSLAQAGANQLSTVLETAETFRQEKTYADYLTTLYELFHALAQVKEPHEVGRIAADKIKNEIDWKKFILFSLNDEETQLIFRFGMADTEEYQLDAGTLNGKNNVISQSIETKQPIIINRETIEPGLLPDSFAGLDFKQLIILPLVTNERVMGCIILEPVISEISLLGDKLPFLMNMGREIASSLLTIKFRMQSSEAEKMQTANLLSSGVSHIFNNLFQVILGQASLIKLESSDSPMVVESLQAIFEAVERGTKIVQNLSNFSSLQKNKNESSEIEVNGFAESIKKKYSMIFTSDTRFTVTSGYEKLKVLGDFELLEQALMSFLTNARDAIKDSERKVVSISINKVYANPGEIHQDLLPGQYVRISVDDSGVGMTPEEQKRCFEPFFTTKLADSQSGVGFRGTGLGLSTIYSIAKLHRGIVTVESSKGHGSRFHLYLPLISLKEEHGKELTEIQLIPDLMMVNLPEEAAKLLREEFESVGFRTITSYRWSAIKQFSQQSGDVPRILVLDPKNIKFNIIDFLTDIRTNGTIARTFIVSNEQLLSKSIALAIPEVEVIPMPFTKDSARELVRRFFLIKNSILIKPSKKVKIDESVVESDIKFRNSESSGIVNEGEVEEIDDYEIH